MNAEHVDGKEGYNDEIKTNGEAGIRTLETVAGLLVFETSPIDHSGTSPNDFFVDSEKSFTVSIFALDPLVEKGNLYSFGVHNFELRA